MVAASVAVRVAVVADAHAKVGALRAMVVEFAGRAARPPVAQTGDIRSAALSAVLALQRATRVAVLVVTPVRVLSERLPDARYAYGITGLEHDK